MFRTLKMIVEWCIEEGHKARATEAGSGYVKALVKLAEAATEVMRFL